MVALLGELVSKGEPVFLYECPESLHCTVVRVQENLGQGNNLKEGEGGGLSVYYNVHMYEYIASYPGLPMFFNVSHEKSGRPG